MCERGKPCERVQTSRARLPRPLLGARKMSKMAAANLAIDEAVLSEWARLSSSAAAGCDVLPLQLAGERITLAGGAPAPPAPDAAQLWAALGAQAAAALTPPPAPLAPGAKPSLLPPRPECRLWLARGCASDAPGAWLLVAFTPEGVHPKNKMLYASARDDLRRGLPGASERLGTDYHASEPAEVAQGAFDAWRRRDSGEAMSSRERQMADMGRALNAERAAMPVAVAPVSSMQRVAFALGAPLREALAGFKGASGGGAPAARWLEVRLGGGAAGGGGGGGEVFELAASGAAGDAKALTAAVWQPAAAEPRFFVTMPEVTSSSGSSSSSSSSSGGGGAAAEAEEGAGAEAAGGGGGGGEAPAEPSRPVLLVYHCPEGAKPKARMLYSTAKSALQAALAAEGVALSKTVRSRWGEAPLAAAAALAPSLLRFARARAVALSHPPPPHPVLSAPPPSPWQAETRDEDDVATAFADFALSPLAKQVSGMAIAVASVGAAKAEAIEAEAQAAKSPASRFGGRALPGMPVGASPAGFRLPGLGEKK